MKRGIILGIILVCFIMTGCATTSFKFNEVEEVTHTSIFMTSNVFVEMGEYKIGITKQAVDMDFITSVLDAYTGIKTGVKPK